jgi:phage replication-related protein YjqB (UPF0714/DUF867 family)
MEVDAIAYILDKHRMADRYRTFKDLAANEQLGVDYLIRVKDRGSHSVILAPHGGWIEPGTSEIAEAIAGKDLSFYAFEALRAGAHGDFHITSHRFDEPKALDLVSRSRIAVAIHGRRNNSNEAVWLGGRSSVLRNSIGDSLRSAGFAAELNTELPGLDRANICNRTLSGEGVQLELSRSLRRRLMSGADLLQAFCEAIRKVIPHPPAT